MPGEVHTLQAGLGGCANGQQSGQTGAFRACHDMIAIRVERLVIEMRVGIE